MSVTVEVLVDFSPFLCRQAQLYLKDIPVQIDGCKPGMYSKSADKWDLSVVVMNIINFEMQLQKKYVQELTLDRFERVTYWINKEISTFSKYTLIASLAVITLGLGLIPLFIKQKSIDKAIDEINQNIFNLNPAAKNDRRNAKIFSSFWERPAMQGDEDGIDQAHRFTGTPMNCSVRVLSEFESLLKYPQYQGVFNLACFGIETQNNGPDRNVVNTEHPVIKNEKAKAKAKAPASGMFSCFQSFWSKIVPETKNNTANESVSYLRNR